MAKINVDISKHFLVPKHTKLSEKDAKKVLDSYNIVRDALPKIHVKDPALSGMKVAAGDIVKVERKSPTSGHIDFYRCVIDG